MSEKTKRVMMFLAVYILIFWIGFKSGGIYQASKIRITAFNTGKTQAATLDLPDVRENREYYIVEKFNYGTYTVVDFTESGKGHVIMKIFFNEKLRPLLKLRDIEIYTDTGDRLY